MKRRTLWAWVGVVALLGMLLPAAAPLSVPASGAPGVPAIEAWLPAEAREHAATAIETGPVAATTTFAPELSQESASTGDAALDLAAAVAALGTDAQPTEVAHLVYAYYDAVGFNVGPGDGVFEENNTLSFSYNVGDVNGDGTDDVGLDQYCTGLDGCVPAGGATSPTDNLNAITHPAGCPGANSHRLLAVSGTDGSVLWSQRIDGARWLLEPVTARPYTCTMEFVVGAVPLEGDRAGLLVYRWSIGFPVSQSTLIDVQHDYYLVDPLDGHAVWHYTKTGVLTGTGAAGVSYVHVENLYLNPVLQVPPREGIRLVPEGTQVGFFVQGVSYDIAFAISPTAVPGHSGAYPLLDNYRPNEWAARIDPASGDVAWEVPTYTPQGMRSVVPHALNTQYGTSCTITGTIGCAPFALGRLPSAAPLAKASIYWSQGGCCFDSTGDGIPDLLFWTHEWSGTPTTNQDGTYMVSSHARLYDGASGAVEWDIELAPDTRKERGECTGNPLLAQPFCLMVQPQIIGDANGDGKSDMLFHVTYYDADYFHRLVVLNGVDGTLLWDVTRPKNIDVLVVGDADGDGGNDIVSFEWHNQGGWFLDATGYSAANVTATALVQRSGASGAIGWRASTFAAPADLRVLFDIYRVNGVPDLDGDGVGDLPIDDPVYYPDLTVVHRVTFLSGRSAQPLFTVHTVGAFAFPARAGDLTGDGLDDLVMINGDVNDLWFTTYDGQGGDSIWSRRALTLRSSNYVSAIARMRTHSLELDGAAANALLVNVHFSVQTQAGGFFTPINTPQLAAYRGLNGTSRWAIPVLQDADFTAVLEGSTPMAALYERAYAAPPAAPMSVASYSAPVRATLGLGLFLVSGLLGFGLTQWRRD